MFGLTAVEGPRINCLRDSIQANQVHFPMPIPSFPYQYRADIQWRLVELYFIRGWSTKRIAERYGLTSRRIQQSLQHWVVSAMERGYLQAIPPEPVFAAAPATLQPAFTIPESRPFMPIPLPAAPGLSAHSV
jgi:hypothetical protein